MSNRLSARPKGSSPRTMTLIKARLRVAANMIRRSQTPSTMDGNLTIQSTDAYGRASASISAWNTCASMLRPGASANTANILALLWKISDTASTHKLEWTDPGTEKAVKPQCHSMCPEGFFRPSLAQPKQTLFCKLENLVGMIKQITQHH